jgi:cytochrome c-type biogenesis protein CcmH
MTAFWISALLIAAAALAIVLRPLRAAKRGSASREALNAAVYRDQLRELEEDLKAGKIAQGDHDRARAEIERRVLEESKSERAAVSRPLAAKRASLYAALALPVLALGLYLAVGNPRALNPAVRENAMGPQQIEAMVQRLADRLQKEPEDVEGWKMLGKSYSVMGRFAEAANAYSKAALRAPRDAGVLADLADALAMARGRSMKGEPEELVLRALQIDPNNLKALALAGTAAFERRDFAGAVRHWERVLPLVEADSEDARIVQSNIDAARAAAAAPPGPAAGSAKPSPPAKPAASAALQGTVKLSPDLASKVSAGDTLFVYARAVEGPPMPLAILRRRAADLPLSFSLDDSMAMSPATRLSAFPKVVVTARISKSGGATPQPGDLQGASAPVASSARSVSITIDKVVR